MKTILLSADPVPMLPRPDASATVEFVFEGEQLQRREFVQVTFYRGSRIEMQTRIPRQYAAALGLAIYECANNGGGA